MVFCGHPLTNPRKGFGRLVEALPLVEGGPIELTVFGGVSEPFAEEIERARRAGVKVELLGYQPRERYLEHLERRTDLLAFPSLYEEWGYALLEALSRGVPALAFDLYPFFDILDEDTGMVVAEGRPGAARARARGRAARRAARPRARIRVHTPALLRRGGGPEADRGVRGDATAESENDPWRQARHGASPVLADEQLVLVAHRRMRHQLDGLRTRQSQLVLQPRASEPRVQLAEVEQPVGGPEPARDQRVAAAPHGSARARALVANEGEPLARSGPARQRRGHQRGRDQVSVVVTIDVRRISAVQLPEAGELVRDHELHGTAQARVVDVRADARAARAIVGGHGGLPRARTASGTSGELYGSTRLRWSPVGRPASRASAEARSESAIHTMWVALEMPPARQQAMIASDAATGPSEVVSVHDQKAATGAHDNMAALPRIRSTIVGLGGISFEHLEKLGRLPDVEVAGVCDLSQTLVDAVAERFGVPGRYTSYEDMLAELEPDSVHVLTPPQTHRRLVLGALDAGAHVLVEKPAAPTWDEYVEMRDRAAERGLLLLENLNYRTMPVVAAIVAARDGGELGEIVNVDVSMGLGLSDPGSPYLDRQTRHFAHDLPGGALQNFASHPASVVAALVGAPRVVRSSLRQLNDAALGPDELRALVEAEHGSATITLTSHGKPPAFTVRVQGTSATLAGDVFAGRARAGARRLTAHAHIRGRPERRRPAWRHRRPRHAHGHRAQLLVRRLRGAAGGLLRRGCRQGRAAGAGVRDGRHEPPGGRAVRSGEPPVRAVVTGGSGFLGSHLMRELERRGDRPVALARPGSRAGDALEAAGHEVAREDLRRPGDGLVSLLAEADAVYHLAAGIAGGWRATFDTNVTATENLVDALRDAGFRGRLVHVSSFSVYGLNLLPPGSVVDESTPVEPEPWRRDDYAWTKVLQERVIRRLEGEGPRARGGTARARSTDASGASITGSAARSATARCSCSAGATRCRSPTWRTRHHCWPRPAGTRRPPARSSMPSTPAS